MPSMSLRTFQRSCWMSLAGREGFAAWPERGVSTRIKTDVELARGALAAAPLAGPVPCRGVTGTVRVQCELSESSASCRRFSPGGFEARQPRRTWGCRAKLASRTARSLDSEHRVGRSEPGIPLQLSGRSALARSRNGRDRTRHRWLGRLGRQPPRASIIPGPALSPRSLPLRFLGLIQHRPPLVAHDRLSDDFHTRRRKSSTKGPGPRDVTIASRSGSVSASSLSRSIETEAPSRPGACWQERGSTTRPTCCTGIRKHSCVPKWMRERISQAVTVPPSPTGASEPADRRSHSAPEDRPAGRLAGTFEVQTTPLRSQRKPCQACVRRPWSGLRATGPHSRVMMRPPSQGRQHDGQDPKAARRPKPSPLSETSRRVVRRELMAPGTSLARDRRQTPACLY